MRLLEKMQIPFDEDHLKHIFKVRCMYIRQLMV